MLQYMPKAINEGERYEEMVNYLFPEHVPFLVDMLFFELKELMMDVRWYGIFE